MAHFIGRRGFLAMAGAGLTLPRYAKAEGLAWLSGRAFGTHWSLAADRIPRGMSASIENLFQAVDRELSPWRADSAVSRFNTGSSGIVPGGELDHVTRAALEIARQSGGAFDPTVGPLVARWGFGPLADGGAPDWRGLMLGREITKARADLTLDLCGIAKGRALDLAIAGLRDAGIGAALFDIGGEVAALGTHPSGRPWRVGVENPLGDGPITTLVLHDGQNVATSGLAAQSYAFGGREWGHIIDPVRKAPAQGALRSVTVLGGNAMLADGWATALFAAGDRRGPELARSEGIAALFLFETTGGLRKIATGKITEIMT